MAVRYGCVVLAVVLLAPHASAQESCYVVDRDGREHWVGSWNRLVVREVEPTGEGPDEGDRITPLDSPGVVSTLLYRAAVIPFEDVRYMLPSLGVYALRDGHLLEGRPLAECGFFREHRFVDLENQRYRSTAAGLDTPSRPSIPLLLKVFVEFATFDTVAGYPVAEQRALRVDDAEIVAFDPEAVEAARDLYRARTGADWPSRSFFPFPSRLSKRTDLRLNPEGERAGSLEREIPVEVLEARGEWVRVRVEGWVKESAVEEKKR